MSTFAQRLGRLLRIHRGERTQAEVAATLGLSDSSYSNYERGMALPTLETLLTLLDVLGIEAGELLALFDGDDEPNGAQVAA